MRYTSLGEKLAEQVLGYFQGPNLWTQFFYLLISRKFFMVTTSPHD